MARKPKLGLPLQTLRNAPDALEGRKLRTGVFEIEPQSVETDGRLDDRLQIEVEGLKASISSNGQRVPILVRSLDGDRYSLIYGRRRLEACRELGIKVRAIVTEQPSDDTLKDQLLENQERSDLSFIERALVATSLLNGDHLSPHERTNKGVAEVLNLTEAGISQLLSVVRAVGEELIRAIGPAPGIGRPRWEELKKSLSESPLDVGRLTLVATKIRSSDDGTVDEKSDKAFHAVLSQVGRRQRSRSSTQKDKVEAVKIPGVGTATITAARRGRRLNLELNAEETEFVSWLEGKTPQLIAELHERWKHSED